MGGEGQDLLCDGFPQGLLTDPDHRKRHSESGDHTSTASSNSPDHLWVFEMPLSHLTTMIHPLWIVRSPGAS